MRWRKERTIYIVYKKFNEEFEERFNNDSKKVLIPSRLEILEYNVFLKQNKNSHTYALDELVARLEKLTAMATNIDQMEQSKIKYLEQAVRGQE